MAMKTPSPRSKVRVQQHTPWRPRIRNMSCKAALGNFSARYHNYNRMVPYKPNDPTRLGFYIRMVDFASHLNAIYPGGFNAAVIIMAIAIADFDSKPVDFSSLAAMLCLPRSTLRRHVIKLEEEGFVTCRKEGKFTMIRVTEKVKTVTIPIFEEHLDKFLPWACKEANDRGIGCGQNG